MRGRSWESLLLNSDYRDILSEFCAEKVDFLPLPRRLVFFRGERHFEFRFRLAGCEGAIALFGDTNELAGLGLDIERALDGSLVGARPFLRRSLEMDLQGLNAA